MPKKVNITEGKNLCGNLQTIYTNREVLMDLFPFYFGINNTEADEISGYCNQTNDTQNADDIHICQPHVLIITYNE